MGVVPPRSPPRADGGAVQQSTDGIDEDSGLDRLLQFGSGAFAELCGSFPRLSDPSALLLIVAKWHRCRGDGEGKPPNRGTAAGAAPPLRWWWRLDVAPADVQPLPSGGPGLSGRTRNASGVERV
eukprot:gene11540-biopygen8358